MTDDTVRQILRDAADYIAEHGHCKGRLESWSPDADLPAVCALGALRRTGLRHGIAAYGAAVGQLADHLRSRDDDPRIPYAWKRWVDSAQLIPIYNDHEATTAEDVILAMKRAAEDR
ncbi:hypothetical protein BJP40_06465 [Streptomyces sp. CC53]|uniref:DUF6197 family protein n=1 Tax=Streptomyces sp. CC53 TaxID=1906740 RepID=UPI0008DC8AAB|nr:hypothetical protein [Streptomyces sp. CC53]OII61166.1 hypothetical protein BJP40_06465 [Streptomyces sp. CC53]